MTYGAWFYDIDKDKMKECMFGMPMRKEEEPHTVYMDAAYTYSTDNVTWTCVGTGDVAAGAAHE